MPAVPTEVVVAVVGAIAVVVSAVVSARAANGARRAAHGARNAAQQAQVSGAADHFDQTERLDTIAGSLADLLRDVGGLRSENRQTRTELHDLRTRIDAHLDKKD